MKRKVCVVITARPSYSRIKSALEAITNHPGLELQLVVAASALLERYGSAVDIIENDGFNVDAKVHMVVEGQNLVTSAKTTGLGIVELSTVFDNLEPDLVVTIADRYETLATAVAAAYTNIPLAHIQGGEITGSIDEKVRHAVTKLSDLHLVSSNKAAERVMMMGESPESIYVTGCPSIDIAAEVMKNPNLDFEPMEKYGGVGSEFIAGDNYMVVLQHPVTQEHDKAYNQVNETLYAVSNIGLPVYWFWPNVDAGSDGTSKGIRAFREREPYSKIRFFKNMLPHDFLKLVYNSKCIIGNSSVAVRECSFMGVPAVNIGSRQNGRDKGMNLIEVDYCQKSIIKAIKKQLRKGRCKSDNLYGNGKAGTEVAKVLAKADLNINKVLAFPNYTTAKTN